MKRSPGDILGLTDRQAEVLALLHRGLKPKQLAEELNMSLPTVRAHLRLIYARLNVPDAMQAVLVWERATSSHG